MGALTEQGYIPSTPQEIQDTLVNYIKKNNPNFEMYSADLQSDLINTSVADLMQYELLTQTMLNTIAPTNSNEWLFNQFADFFGLEQHSNINNSVTLKASGLNPNAYIPSNLEFINNGNTFINYAPSIADENGNATIEVLNKEYDQVIAPNQTFTCSEFSNAKFTNPNQSELIAPESFLEYKTRIQNNFRANTQCSYDLLATELSNLGVTNFSVHLEPPTKDNDFAYSQTLIFLPSIINKETELKGLIFGTMGVNCYLKGATSDNDNTRVRETTIDFFGSQLPIVYVVAKIVRLNVTITLKMNVLLEIWQYFLEQLELKIKTYFKNSKIGDTINTFLFNKMIYQTLNECNIDIDRLESIALAFDIGGQAVNINSENQVIECSAFDTHLNLGTLNVTKATN